MDEKISTRSTKKDEKEANAFALELISGDPSFTLRSSRRRPTAHQLALEARDYGHRMQIDPGFITLTYSWKKGSFPVGVAALNLLNPRASAAEEFERYYTRLDLAELPDDSRHVFECLTKAA